MAVAAAVQYAAAGGVVRRAPAVLVAPWPIAEGVRCADTVVKQSVACVRVGARTCPSVACVVVVGSVVS